MPEELRSSVFPASTVVSLIVARAQNGVIGRDNALPWRLAADLKRFKAVTLGKPILMGRRTYESIGRPLPGRTNLVLTRDRSWAAEGIVAVHSLEEAVNRVKGSPELMVIGGAEIYRLALPLAQRIYITEVSAEVPGDTEFPAIDEGGWSEVERSVHEADAANTHAMTFRVLARRPP